MYRTPAATWRFIAWTACILVASTLGRAGAAETAAEPYLQLRERILKANAADRRVPVIPPKDQKLRVIIDADAHNEIDDVWAIALALLSPERFQIEGFVAAKFLDLQRFRIALCNAPQTRAKARGQCLSR